MYFERCSKLHSGELTCYLTNKENIFMLPVVNKLQTRHVVNGDSADNVAFNETCEPHVLLDLRSW